MVAAPIELKRGMGSSTTDRKFCSTDRGSACPRSRSAAAAAALNDHLNLAAFYPIRCPQRARARRAPIPASTDVDRPARAGWAALRLLADVVRGDDGARAIGAIDD